MIINNNVHLCLKVAISLVGTLVSLTVVAVLPAQAQEEEFSLVFESIHVESQSVEVLDPEGNSLGDGEFRAQMLIGGDGRISGKAAIDLDNGEISITSPNITLTTVIYEDGNPVGVVFSGRIEETWDGQTYTSAGTITLKRGITSELTIWEWEKEIDTGSPIDTASLAAVTELRFRRQ
jgi:hypothetical protein